MPITVTIRWSSEWKEFRVVPAGLSTERREAETYFTEDYADAVGTAQTIAGPGGVIIDHTPKGKRFNVFRTVMSPVLTEWSVGFKDKYGVVRVERAYAAPTSDIALCDAALRHAVADAWRLSGWCP